MPTRHPRIGLIRDERIEEALRTAREATGSVAPDAALARELLLLGATEVTAGRLSPRVRALVESRGARPAAITHEEMLARLGPAGPIDATRPRPGTDALQEQRRERLG